MGPNYSKQQKISALLAKNQQHNDNKKLVTSRKKGGRAVLSTKKPVSRGAAKEDLWVGKQRNEEGRSEYIPDSWIQCVDKGYVTRKVEKAAKPPLLVRF
jgi:hypothetical protein